MGNWLTRLVAVCLAFALVAVGCSGDDDADGGRNDSSPNPSPLPRGENTELLIEILDELNAAKDATYKVVYEFSGQPENGIPAGTLTIVQRPPDLRTEILGGPDDLAIAFVGGETGTIACQGNAGPDTYQCFETSALMRTSPLTVTSDDLIAIADSLRSAQGFYSFSERTEEIADVEATCLTATATEAITEEVRNRVGETVEVCVAPDGVPLVIEKRGGIDDLSARATEFTTDVDDEEFEPPALVQPGAPNFQAPQPPETVPEGES